jgi:hypothetical protein
MPARLSLTTVVPLIGTLSLIGCSRSASPTAATSPLSSASSSSSGAASLAVTSAGVVSNTIIPTPPNAVIFDSCTGEGVHVTGTVHLVTVLTIDATGGTHTEMHFNVQGVSGVGLISGIKYRGIHTETHSSTSNGPAPSESTTVIDIKLISQGASSNLTIRDVLFHVTVNAGGTVTASIDKLATTECQ